MKLKNDFVTVIIKLEKYCCQDSQQFEPDLKLTLKFKKLHRKYHYNVKGDKISDIDFFSNLKKDVYWRNIFEELFLLCANCFVFKDQTKIKFVYDLPEEHEYRKLIPEKDFYVYFKDANIPAIVPCDEVIFSDEEAKMQRKRAEPELYYGVFTKYPHTKGIIQLCLHNLQRTSVIFRYSPEKNDFRDDDMDLDISNTIFTIFMEYNIPANTILILHDKLPEDHYHGHEKIPQRLVFRPDLGCMVCPDDGARLCATSQDNSQPSSSS